MPPKPKPKSIAPLQVVAVAPSKPTTLPDATPSSHLTRTDSAVSVEVIPADPIEPDTTGTAILRRTRSDQSEHGLFEMDSDHACTQEEEPHVGATGAHTARSTAAPRRGSVEHEIPIVSVLTHDDEDAMPAIEEKLTEIAISRADSPVEDLESALLSAQPAAAAAAASPAAYQLRPATCTGLTVGDFELLSVVGRGAYGKVFLVRRPLNGRYYALKVVRKSEAIRKNVVVNARAERDILEAVRHPFIVNLRYAFQSPSKLYLCMDYASGGELFARLNDSRDHALPLKDCRFYAAELVLALEHLHSLHIIYRDLKPENILLSKDGHIVLTDFGFAKGQISRSDEGTRSFCGTLHYMAPEMIRYEGHGKGSDWWALGILLCEMITGSCPFNGANRKVLQENILNAPLKLPKYLDQPTKSILTELLRRPISKRLGCGPDGAAAIRRHPFFTGIDWVAMSKKQVPPPFIPVVQNEHDTSRFDAKFTDERVVDTPCSPQQMASILHEHGISPSTFHQADETFAGFSYARDHTPGPSPAIRGLVGPRTARAGSGMLASSLVGSSFSSPRPLSSMPPLHHASSGPPDLLELPPSTKPTSLPLSIATLHHSSLATVTESDMAPQSILAIAKATSATVAPPRGSAASSTAVPPSADTTIAASATGASFHSPKVNKPQAVRATPSPPAPSDSPSPPPALVSPRQNASASQLSRQLAERKAANGSPLQAASDVAAITAATAALSAPSSAHSAASNSLGIRMIGGIKQLAPQVALTSLTPPAMPTTSTAAVTSAPLPVSTIRPPSKGLSANAPAFIPGRWNAATAAVQPVPLTQTVMPAPISFSNPLAVTQAGLAPPSLFPLGYAPPPPAHFLSTAQHIPMATTAAAPLHTNPLGPPRWGVAAPSSNGHKHR